MNASPGSSPNRAAEVGDIDFSCRLPMLMLFLSAAFWLLIGSAFGLIASIKFHSSNFLADNPHWTYGRIHPAALDAFLYGFCLQAGLGVALWILAHLGRAVLVQPLLVTIGAAFWNLGVTIGICGILCGDATGFQNLEMPHYAVPFLFLGYLLVSLLGVFTFHQRRDRVLVPSQWFLFTALFWFIWIYSTAALLLVTFPVRGVTQAVIAWWYSDNFTVVWIGLVGLGTLFYFLPKLTRREEDCHYLALLAYWLFILFAGWSGVPGSAPVPAWMPVLSCVATMMTLVPLLSVAIIGSQWFGIPPANRDADNLTPDATSLRFFRFGLASFLLAGLMRILSALEPVARVTDLTWFTVSTAHLQTYGFFAMVILGALYHIVPRLMGIAFPFGGLIRVHFWLAALGVVFIALPLAGGGIVEGLRLQQPAVAFIDVFKSTLMFLRMSTVGDLLLLVGHLLFLVNLCGLVKEFYRVRAESAYAVLTADLFKQEGAKSS